MRSYKSALGTIVAASGKPAMADRKNRGGMRSVHVKVKFGVGPFK